MSMGNYFSVPLFFEHGTRNDRYREILGLASTRSLKSMTLLLKRDSHKFSQHQNILFQMGFHYIWGLNQEIVFHGI